MRYRIEYSGTPADPIVGYANTIREARAIVRRRCQGQRMHGKFTADYPGLVEGWNETARDGCETFAIVDTTVVA